MKNEAFIFQKSAGIHAVVGQVAIGVECVVDAIHINHAVGDVVMISSYGLQAFYRSLLLQLISSPIINIIAVIAI
jgi:hypothetical protein